MRFYIYSLVHQQWWRGSALGYTNKRDQAGIFDLEEVKDLALSPWEPDLPPWEASCDVLIPVEA